MHSRWQQLKCARYSGQGTETPGRDRGAFSHHGGNGELSVLIFIAIALAVGLLTLLVLARWAEQPLPMGPARKAAPFPQQPLANRHLVRTVRIKLPLTLNNGDFTTN